MAASLVRVFSKIIHGHVLPAAAVQHHPVCPRWAVSVCPAAFIHTGSVSASPSSSAVTVTEEPDTLYQKLSVLVKGHDKSVLDSYEFFATLAAQELGLTLEKVFEPPKDIDKLTLLKSIHIFKKHRVQYEMRTHYRCIKISRITGSTVQVYLEYIQRNLPEGVAMEVTKTAIEKIPEHIQKPLWDANKLESSQSER
ncbi:probable 28S ribosomal protein S10, mitochondrial [Myxocyprinus asiaticus]|uniref:probable 28S ribosomal protein S10, mitochondrial n=1 Tax=Myxocyprinus asiaticus TaxID=70543 RepID=UPI00222245FB|nr:probable 28S ribosomal protein S10, mitochondrial [Myxocyprinus asiaticus]